MADTRSDIIQGDNSEVLSTFPDDYADAVITDPPYGIGFMGKDWDTFTPGREQTRLIANDEVSTSANPNVKGRRRSPASSPSSVEYNRSLEGQRLFQDWTARWARECLRVLKPGGYAVVFGAPRSFHRMACGLEDAGFEIRDTLSWVFGQGFPKSLNLHDQWAGWGTALKPAWEPIILARKPCVGTLTANVREFRTGAINIDGCRVATSDTWAYPNGPGGKSLHYSSDKRSAEVRPNAAASNPAGRWPANLLHDGSEEATASFPSAPGQLARESTESNRRKTQHVYGRMAGGSRGREPREDTTTSAARFFYQAKTSTGERNYGCDHLPAATAGEMTGGRKEGSAGLQNPRAGAGRGGRLYSPEKVPYPSAAWVNAVLARRLPAATAQSLRKATVGSTIRSSDGSVWSMCWCGSPSTDLSRPAIKSIIATETSWTTDRAISNSSPRRHTNGCMAAAYGVTALGGSPVGFAASLRGSPPTTGTSAEKGGRNTADAAPATSVESWLTSDAAEEGGIRVGSVNSHPT